jgi:hypothetical protein
MGAIDRMDGGLVRCCMSQFVCLPVATAHALAFTCCQSHCPTLSLRTQTDTCTAAILSLHQHGLKLMPPPCLFSQLMC